MNLKTREQKALEIAARSKITKNDKGWLVPSQTNGSAYTVKLDGDSEYCNCPDFQARQQRCKHILATEIVIQRESTTTETTAGKTVTTTTTETVKIRYNQIWPAYNKAQTTEKSRFVKLLHELTNLVDEPIQLAGRPRIPMADMIFAASYKIYSTISTRRFMTDLREAYTRRYITQLPGYNSIIRYLEKPEMTPYLESLIVQSSLPLKAIEHDFAVDSSGFSTCNYVRWFDHKYGKEQVERDWVKAHLITGVVTNIVTSVEVSGAYGADSNYLPALVNQTAKHFEMREVSADKAYSSRANMRVVEAKGATPYIEFKENATGTSKSEIWQKMFHYYSMNRADFYQHYHKRSNVETTFSMVKAKFGGFVRSKLPTAQANEVLCKILAHNLCVLIQSHYELGIEAKFWTE